MTINQESLNRDLFRVGVGILAGVVAVATLTIMGRNSETPEEPVARVHGVVHNKLRDDCDLVDPALLKRMFGAGKATSVGSSDDGTSADCQFSAKKVQVDLTAELEDYPEGGEVAAAVDTYADDLANAEEGDPAHGLPVPVRGLGDEAFTTYDPEDGAVEQAQVEVRSGNAVITVVVSHRRKPVANGHDTLVGQAKRTAASVLARMPR